MPTRNNPHTLGTEPIGRLLVQYSLPAIIGMTLTSLCNIIDSVFIGHGIGAYAISGLAISFPLMNLVMAFCTLVGVGGATIASIRLGQKDMRGASEVLGNVLSFGIINGILFGSISLLFLDEILVFFGASAETLPYARDFMKVILLGTPVSYTMIGLNNLMRATGYPRKAMLTSIVTLTGNVVLAPILIFGLQWGMAGAGLATVASQFAGMMWILHHFMRKDSYIRFERGIYRLKGHIAASIFSIGLSPFLMNICASAIVVVINTSLKEHGGDLAIGAYGIINRVLTLFTMVVLGLAMGMQPIVGYNHGARIHQRVQRTLKYGIIAGVAITSAGFIACECFPQAITSMFTDNAELSVFAETGLRACVMMYPLVGCQMVITQFFQSIGKAKVSIFLSLTRQLIYLLPCLLVLPAVWGVNGVWASMPLSDVFAFLTAVGMLLHYQRQWKKKQPAVR